MSEQKHMLIGSFELGQTTTGKRIVKLYSVDTRLQYPELVLFDLTLLQDIGVDPNTLETGQRIYHRFHAYYTESDKKTSNGNPYRDVAYLEPISPHQSDGDQDTRQLLTEIRQLLKRIDHNLSIILPLIDVIAENTTFQPIHPDDQDPDTHRDFLANLCDRCQTHPCICDQLDDPDDEDPILRYTDGTIVSDNPVEIAAYVDYCSQTNTQPPSLVELRRWHLENDPGA